MGRDRQNFLQYTAAVVACLVLWPAPLWGRKTNQAVYQDAFDRGAGGASLTLASREGRIFANPAQLPYGGKFHRWLGTSFSLFVSKDWVDEASSGFSSLRAPEGENQEAGGSQAIFDLIDTLEDKPVYAGTNFALAWVTSHYAVGTFLSSDLSIGAATVDEAGLPSLYFGTDIYGGAAFSLASLTPWRWLAIGVTTKYVYALEAFERFTASDAEAFNERMGELSRYQDIGNYNRGLGFDVGTLFFLQGPHVDWRLALKVDDVGDTQFQGDFAPESFKQVISAGVSTSVHSSADILHLALDYRDITGSYRQKNDPGKPEELFKRVYAGAKVCLRTYLGLATGLYHGHTTYGVEIDMIFMRLALSHYTVETGDHPGAEPAIPIYLLNLAFGF